MKKFLCIAFAACALMACTACGGGAKKTGDIPDITKGYYAGFESASSVTINLDDYVDAKGTEICYEATSAHPEVATVSVDGSKLTATMHKAEGESLITVTVNSNGKKAFNLSFAITAATMSTEYKKVACIGDSLTYGHSWHNESYPVYLQQMLGSAVTVGNFGVNGSAVTDRNDSSYKLKYDTLSEYRNSIQFQPDVVIIMLGTNDGWDWTGAQPTFVEEYEKLIDNYYEWGVKEVILLTSPPTLENNAFDLPNDVIGGEVCPLQRTIAKECGVRLVDVRKAFEAHEDMETLFRLPASSDGVHLSVAGAQLVAGLVADALVQL